MSGSRAPSRFINYPRTVTVLPTPGGTERFVIYLNNLYFDNGTSWMLVSLAVAPDVPTSGLTLHLKADSITGLTDGTAIQTWADSSGNGYDAIQGTSGNRPLYKTNRVNSKPAVLFDGVDDYFASAASASLKPFTVFSVVSVPTITDAATIIGSDVGGGIQIYVDSNTRKLQFNKQNIAALGTSSSALGTSAFTVVKTSYSAAGLYTFKIGSNAASSGTNDVTFTAGTLVNIGRFGGGLNYFKGDMAEFIMWNRVLSVDEDAAVVAYLSAKYAL